MSAVLLSREAHTYEWSVWYAETVIDLGFPADRVRFDIGGQHPDNVDNELLRESDQIYRGDLRDIHATDDHPLAAMSVRVSIAHKAGAPVLRCLRPDFVPAEVSVPGGGLIGLCGDSNRG